MTYRRRFDLMSCRSSAFRVATLLLISVGVAGCGSAGGHDRKSGPRSLSLANAKGN